MGKRNRDFRLLTPLRYVRNDRTWSYAKVSEKGTDGKCRHFLTLVRDDDFPTLSA